MTNGLGFASGAVWGVLTGSNQTPTRFGVLQNTGLDLKASTKPLYGTNQLPVSVARGTMTVSGKAEIAAFVPRMYNDLFFSSMSTPTPSSTTVCADSEAGTVPGTSTYTITVTNSATFTRDLGVNYSATGLPLTRVVSLTAVGQYTVSAGVYTFYSGDASVAMKLSYEYTITAGETLAIANQPMGTLTPYITVLSINNPNTTKKTTITLNSCVSNSISITTSLEDYTKTQFMYDAFTDSSDVLGSFAFGEVM